MKREHTGLLIRQMLAHQRKDDGLDGLKEQVRHKNRILNEAALSKQAVLNRMSNPKYVFTKEYWDDVAQLAVTGQIDPTSMEKLYAPRTARGLSRLSHITPGAVGKVGSVLRGLKSLKGAFERGHGTDVELERGRAAVEEPVSHAPTFIRGAAPRRALGRVRHVTVELPTNISVASSKRYHEHLQDVLYRKLYEYGDVKAFITALEKLKGRRRK
jgi:hypothetical protein